MEIVHNDDDLRIYMATAVKEISHDAPILVDKYIVGKELEIDAICDGEHVYIPGIMEHIERAGIHSGDSISVYPPQTISWRQERMEMRKWYMFWRSIREAPVPCRF